MGFNKVTLRAEIIRIFLRSPPGTYLTASQIAEMTGAESPVIGGVLRRLKMDGFLESEYYRTSGGCLWKRSDRRICHMTAVLVNSCISELTEADE